MNKVILKGNVGKDPQITNFKDGGRAAQFTLATTERGYTTRDGREIPEHTDWHNIVVKQTGLAGVVELFVKKGTPLLICGKIQTREYNDEAGYKRHITEIIVDEMELLGAVKRDGGAPGYVPIENDDEKLPDEFNRM